MTDEEIEEQTEIFDLVIYNAVLVDGTGTPPYGPVSIAVNDDTIVIVDDENKRYEAETVIDAEKGYVAPGFVDMHAHIPGNGQNVPDSYVYKLWLAHGITSIREPGCLRGLNWVVEQARRSRSHEIDAPYIYPYSWLDDEDVKEEWEKRGLRAAIRYIKQCGAKGVKIFDLNKNDLHAAFDEAMQVGLQTAMHHQQRPCAQVDALYTARQGLTTIEHGYGIPEALLVDRTLMDIPPEYNNSNELHRFRQAGRRWQQAAEVGNRRWEEVLGVLIEEGVVLDPTFTIYEATRDLSRVKYARWHDDYTYPELMEFFRPDPDSHGSFYESWTTQDEIVWRETYRKWMRFVNDFKNKGGRVTTGSDSGFIYKTYGFGYVREIELLQEAGFSPLEALRSATIEGARTLDCDDQFGSIDEGKRADMVVVGDNMLENAKVLYGTGPPTGNGTGIQYTIKGGQVFDPDTLLGDVREIVESGEGRK